MLKIFRKFPFTHFKSFRKSKSSTYNFATAAAKKPEVQAFNESFLSGSNSAYIEQIFEDWIKDKTSVHSSWDAYFTNVLKGYEPEETFQMPPSLSPSLPVIDLKKTQKKTALSQYLSEILRLELMIQGFQFRGNEMADLDPLQLASEEAGKKIPRNGEAKLQPSYWGFTEADMEREFDIRTPIMAGLTSLPKKWKLKELYEELKRIYCSKVGYEYSHMSEREEKNWIRERIENKNLFDMSKGDKLLLLDRLGKNETFNMFVKNKFTTVKRFGIEGCDTFISGLGKLVDLAGSAKMEHMVFGMAHRGRLNTLAFILNKSVEEIFGEFQEIKPEQTELHEEVWGNSGDVKYHLGTTWDKFFSDGHNMRLTILANPSHLESVNPIVCGKVRAVQDFTKDHEGDRGVGVIIHGDASFAGQGVVYETMQFAELHKYKTHGVVHIVINNQLGFTTVPKDARSGLFCTDLAKSLDSPVFHVNADEPEMVEGIIKLAFEYRQKFKKDVFVDIIGYRRYGHNELDQPGFTQPLMYKTIEKTLPVFEKYSRKLIAEGIIDEKYKQDLMKKYHNEFDKACENSRNHVFNRKDWIPKPWEELRLPSLWGTVKDTGVPISTLREISDKIHMIPTEFHAHPQIRKFYEQRHLSIKEGLQIDFATSEAMAFASLLYEGYGVRLSGQDVERGTFSHRHSVLKDQTENKNYTPLQSILKEGESHNLSICNSHLSEFGVLGFEYGYSLAHPNVLVMWEAQFGDFANGAQIMIDNYITSGESKWGVQSGVTLLLPHGMDGQGPEHSSARIERYLQLSDDDVHKVATGKREKLKDQIKDSNIQIVQCSNSANYFHALRRQMRRPFRKPLVMLNSKKLLRYKGASSNIEEFNQGRRFQKMYPEVYPESLVEPKEVRRVLICSGQVYYDLLEKRRDERINNVAIIRIEQLAPFPYDFLLETLKPYKKADVYWVQEEHQNYGPWFFVKPRIHHILKDLNHHYGFDCHEIKYCGRKPSGSPATGLAKVHKAQQEKILTEAFQK